MPKVVSSVLKPFWATKDGESCRLYHGDVLSVLRRMPSDSVHCCVTSPPYWGLRDYKTGTWTGGDPDCDHVEVTAEEKRKSHNLGPKPENSATFNALVRQFAERCGKCGAERTDQQIGAEKSPKEFVAKMVEVFREVRRVLRDDGTLWLNLGDTYDDGNLLGIPWQVAFALVADGWKLVQDIIWHKPAPMPESVTNRCTKSHEYIFMLVKKRGYYFDQTAILERQAEGSLKRSEYGFEASKDRANLARGTGDKFITEQLVPADGLSNKRSVWKVSSQGYEGAHFAVFPPKLITPCVLAGTSEKGCCVKCGAPWQRILEKKKLTRERPNDYVKRTGEEGTGNSCANSVAGVETRTKGWKSTCLCNAGVQPCLVLDPFVGSGTTMQVALENGRWGVGIDLSEEYLRKNAIPRVEGVLLADRGSAGLVQREVKAVAVGRRLEIR